MPEHETGSGSATEQPKPGTVSKIAPRDRCPIITSQTSILQALSAADLARRRRLVAKLHALGPPALFHFLTDLERGGDLRETLENYGSLPVDLVRAHGGDRFPELFVIGGRS